MTVHPIRPPLDYEEHNRFVRCYSQVSRLPGAAKPHPADFAELSRQIELVSTELTDRFEKFGAAFPATREPSHVSLSRPFGECPGRISEFLARHEKGMRRERWQFRVKLFCLAAATFAVCYFAWEFAR